MFCLKPNLFKLIVLLTLVAVVGCDDGKSQGDRVIELDDADFRQGLTFEKQHESRRALECFLKVIDSRRGAAESHLEAGRMYLDLKDPLSAIYHFNEYIRLKPTSEQSKIVRQMIKTAEKVYLEQIPGRPLEPDAVGSSDQNSIIRKLQIENDKLKREVSELSRINKVSEKTSESTPSTLTNKPTSDTKKSAVSYTIKSGDSLSTISRTFYGTDRRKMDIFNANRSKILDPERLKVGTVIQIPQ